MIIFSSTAIHETSNISIESLMASKLHIMVAASCPKLVLTREPGCASKIISYAFDSSGVDGSE